MNKEKLIDALMAIHAMCMDADCKKCCLYRDFGCELMRVVPYRYDELIDFVEDKA